MNKLLALGMFSILFSIVGCQQSGEQNGHASQEQNEHEDWHGPGWYYGRWFYVESDYVAWRRQARREGRRVYRRNQYYHQHHR